MSTAVQVQEKEKEETPDKEYRKSEDPRNYIPSNLWKEWNAEYHKKENGDARR